MTGEKVIDAFNCKHVLAAMATAGLYEHSGDWLYQVGLPGKSGVSGGIVTISPGKGGLGTFSPRLDQAGNSVRDNWRPARGGEARTQHLRLQADRGRFPYDGDPGPVTGKSMVGSSCEIRWISFTAASICRSQASRRFSSNGESFSMRNSMGAKVSLK